MTMYAGTSECPYDVWKKKKRTNESKKKKSWGKLKFFLSSK